VLNVENVENIVPPSEISNQDDEKFMQSFFIQDKAGEGLRTTTF
jgi:hypothetical protein